ncbi:histidinol-phosphatase [Clostridium botulinum]|uniref:histidinol-phosphatase n=1 Tax=Clostridium botulinum TaxID=1491 RepID=UPI001FD70569|nr:histidinol-phosphatase [Clostridium botulinum]MCJ8174443.1 histidinol-phosphatase [Clostridium botulinum]
MKIDLHTHHERCGHAVGSLKDYIEHAIKNGVSIIGISDHSPFFHHEEDRIIPKASMAKSEFCNYVFEVLQLKEKYKEKIEILLGVESSFYPEYYETYNNIYREFPFDYIIGSVHHTNGLNIYKKERWKDLSEEQCHKEVELYNELIQRLAKSRCFNIVGHLDAFKNFYPEEFSIKSHITDRSLETIAKYDVAIEVNTSGLTKECNEWFPSYEVLERAFFYGIKVTFASDAHSPERICEGWFDVVKALKKIGYNELAIFRYGKRTMIKI